MATDTGSQQGLEGPAGPRSSPNDDAYRPIITSNNSNQNVIHGPGNIVNYNPNITYIGSSLALQRMVRTDTATRFQPNRLLMRGFRMQLMSE